MPTADTDEQMDAGAEGANVDGGDDVAADVDADGLFVQPLARSLSLSVSPSSPLILRSPRFPYRLVLLCARPSRDPQGSERRQFITYEMAQVIFLASGPE
uniref:Uncharacterized protein n=1 Tax=Pseudictyota dubia TaxID=2749911 RepID=A0A7R9VH53_9STRA|mmetsp:Transcript_13250/g.24676  ORF Transcript_13250/g.24676 Transcript_13250/m.24676 type:complete len:100 (+) Transcript_13250:117-416(+)